MSDPTPTTLVCPVCKGAGVNRITPYPFEPRTWCECGRCMGAGRVKVQSRRRADG